MKHRTGKSFFLRIIFPTLLTIILFVTSMFLIIIPLLEEELMDDKREMIRKLTNSAWSLLEEHYTLEEKGLLSKTEAQKRAIQATQSLRYGKERKDYFWITDTSPTLIMHPYRNDLIGTNLLEYTDKNEKKLFREIVEIAQKYGDGFVDYYWQWQDDQTKIVPKVSYVKSFAPWSWIIGTGIYLDDVEEEIGAMSSSITKISFFITFLIALMLFYITLESLKIEKNRAQAETGLKESEKKYRALVEASTEGVLMFIEGRLVYSNKPVLEMLGHTEGLTETDLENIFSRDPKSCQSFKDILKNPNPCRNFETRLVTANGKLLETQISAANITLEKQAGVILTLKDISKNKKVEEELGLTQQRYQSLADNLHIGVFRIDASKNGNFIDANTATAEILGFKNRDQIFNTSFSRLFTERHDWANLKAKVIEKGFVKKSILPLKRDDGSNTVLSISMRETLNDEGIVEDFEGIIEDISARVKNEQERENLIVELQTSLLFINQPIREFTTPPLTCKMNYSIHKAAGIMKKHRQSAILIQTETGDDLGIVTDFDISHRVVAENMALETPVYQIMSSPIISLPDDALVFEAALLTQEEFIGHLHQR